MDVQTTLAFHQASEAVGPIVTAAIMALGANGMHAGMMRDAAWRFPIYAYEHTQSRWLGPLLDAGKEYRYA